MSFRVDETVLLASGARTTTQTLGPFSNPDSIGDIDSLEVIVDLTAFTTAASLTLSIEEYNQGSGQWRSVLAGTALAANGVSRLRYSPWIADVANASRNGAPAKWYRIVVTHGNANSHTYSVVVKNGRQHPS